MSRDLSLRQRVMLLVLLPTLTISLLLGFTFTLTRLQDLEQGLQDRATLISEQLAPLAAQVLERDQPELRQQILHRALEQPDVRAATLYDQNGEIIGHSGPQMLNAMLAKERGLTEETHLLDGDEEFRILRPLVNHSGFFLERAAQPHQLRSLGRQRIGWLELEFSRDSNQVKTYQTFLASGLLIQAGILLNLLLALTLGRRITQPIKRIKNVIAQINEGDEQARIPVRGRDELNQLSRQINELIDSMQHARQDLMDDIEQTTGDLKQTLERLEVNNVELDLARKKAQDGYRTKSEFLANMSHELRTPLNSMIGFTKLLQRSELSEHQRDYLDTIRSSADGLLSMLNSILDYSKLEAGKLELNQTPFNLRELVEQVLALLAPSAHEKDLELIHLIYSDVPLELESDPLRLKQILTNLVGNAIKFTDKGNICVRVMVEAEKEGRQLIKISITDTGIGISDKQIGKLFKAFAQADPSSTRRIGGTGLGLKISKGLVTKMGGEIGVESEEGEGSTFWFSFWAESATVSVGPKPIQLNGKQALLFETDELARTSYQHQLALHGLKVQECAQFEQLRHALNRQCSHLDLVVLSYHPVELSSAQIKKLLDTIEGHCARFIIICSTRDEQALAKMLEQHRNCICLVKPLSLHHLNRALDQLMKEPPVELVHNQKTVPLEQQSNNSQQSPISLGQTRPASRNQQLPNILAVDDNPANLKLVDVLLRELGTEVTTAAGGQQALDLALGQHYDLIFMDIQMPDIDGVTVTRTLREQPGPNCETPIIALTAHALAEEKRKLLQAGMEAYLTKPIDEYQLQQVIERWTGYDFTSQRAPQAAENNRTAKSLPLVDKDEGIRLAGGKQELAQDLLQMLLKDLEIEQSGIKQAQAKQDWTALLKLVHKQHGATRYCGVPRLRQACQQAEEALKDANCKCETRGQYIDLLLQEINALLDWRRSQLSTSNEVTPAQL